MIRIKLWYLCSITLLLFSLSTHAYKNTYAVIIGVADYKYMEKGDGDLNWTVNDAYKMAEFLMSKEGGSVPQQNIHMFLDDDANKSDILYYSKRMFARARPGDRVMFYFSGHGQKGAFVPYDVDGSGSKLLYFKELKEVLTSLGIGFLFIFLIGLALAYFISSYITRSLKTVSDKMSETRLNKRNEKIVLKDASEEIHNLVDSYNGMVD